MLYGDVARADYTGIGYWVLADTAVSVLVLLRKLDRLTLDVAITVRSLLGQCRPHLLCQVLYHMINNIDCLI